MLCILYIYTRKTKQYKSDYILKNAGETCAVRLHLYRVHDANNTRSPSMLRPGLRMHTINDGTASGLRPFSDNRCREQNPRVMNHEMRNRWLIRFPFWTLKSLNFSVPTRYVIMMPVHPASIRPQIRKTCIYIYCNIPGLVALKLFHIEQNKWWHMDSRGNE